MKKEVYKYFENLENSHLKKQKGAFLFDEKCKDLGQCEDSYDLNLIKIDDHQYYQKPWGNKYSINSIVASDLYSELGLITPPIYKLQKKDKSINPFQKYFYEISEDIMTLENAECILAENEEMLGRIHDITRLDGFKWAQLYDYYERQQFLNFMTEECYDEFILCFLLAELRTDSDLHNRNFILYKNKGGDKWEHIIPIDMELSRILHFRQTSKNDFEEFLTRTYSTYGPDMWTDDEITYKKRLHFIQELINDGVLSKYILDKLTLALNYNYPEKIKESFRDLNERDNRNQTYNAFARLWEYNRNTLKDDLGL